jgi:hypothetical protein
MKKLARNALRWCGCDENPPEAGNGFRTPNAGQIF